MPFHPVRSWYVYASPIFVCLPLSMMNSTYLHVSLISAIYLVVVWMLSFRVFSEPSSPYLRLYLNFIQLTNFSPLFQDSFVPIS